MLSCFTLRKSAQQLSGYAVGGYSSRFLNGLTLNKVNVLPEYLHQLFSHFAQLHLFWPVVMFKPD